MTDLTHKKLDEIITYHECSHMGVQPFKVYERKLADGRIEVRSRISIMGQTNETETDDPFSDRFTDNYSSGIGATRELAEQAMLEDMHKLSNSLWL